MDAIAQTMPVGKSSRLRAWLARRWVAIAAVVVVCGVLGRMNCWVRCFQEKTEFVQFFGWPRRCVERSSFLRSGWVPRGEVDWSITSWPSLLLDIGIAVSSLAVTWLIFSRTQRRCQRWNQISLATLLALAALAAILCAIWTTWPYTKWFRSESPLAAAAIRVAAGVPSTLANGSKPLAGG